MKNKKPMRKFVKVLLWVMAGIFLLVSCAFALVRGGVLVTPTEKSLATMTEVPSYDLLEWQYEREEEILTDYEGGTYTMQSPYIIVDPYDMNPCAALVIFEAQQAGNIDVTIAGDDAYSTLQYTKEIDGTHCEVPIIGLYAGRENTVTLQDEYGNTSVLTIETESLPSDFQVYELVTSEPAEMEEGLTLFIACFEDSYTALLDNNADVRGYLSNQYMAHGTAIIQLANGNMLSTGDEYKQVPYNLNSLWEFNWLGKIFKEYEVPNAVHHNISEMPDGNILAVSNNVDMFTTGTREDHAIIIDRETGEIIKDIDFNEILDDTREPYNHFGTGIVNVQNIDWMHMNAAVYDEENNALIVSSPIQSEVVSIDMATEEINWILGPHEGYEGSSEYLAEYLLTPVGDDFEWQWCQHAPMILPDFDNDPDTIDILLLDNGQNKSYDEEDATAAADNYSRGVQYRINQKTMTVEQIWEYGEERGSECYATYLGDADYLYETGNRLMCFGGQLRVDGEPVDDIISGVLGNTVTNSRVVEVSEDGEVVYEVAVHENEYSLSAETYQTERLTLYQDASFDYELGEIKAERVGQTDNNDIDEETSAPNVYIGDFEASFNKIFNENGRLVMDGSITYEGGTYYLGKSVVILRSTENTYVFSTYNALNSRFFASIDTTQLESGVYQISLACGVREGNDMVNGTMHTGHILTEYKITVP